METRPYNLRNNPKPSKKAMEGQQGNNPDPSENDNTSMDDHPRDDVRTADTPTSDATTGSVTPPPNRMDSTDEVPDDASRNSGQTTPANNDLERIMQMLTLQMEKINNIESSQLENRQLELSLNEKMNDLRDELKNTKIEIMEQCRKEILQTMTNKAGEIEDNLNQNVDKRFKEQEEKIRMKINNSKEEIRAEMIDRIEEGDSKANERVDEIETEVRKVTESQRVVQNVVRVHDAEIEKLRELARGHSTLATKEIIVTCAGNNLLSTDHIPKFTGRAQNPRLILGKMCKYYHKVMNRYHGNKDELLHEVIENCLDYQAAKWWEMTKDEVKNWNDFETLFLEKFWNREVQRGIRERLEIEKYRPGGKLTRAEYFIERVITLRSMKPQPCDEEIISTLSRHYEGLIQDACRVQNVRTIKDMELLLQREDLKQLHNSAHQRHREDHPNHRPQNNSGTSQEYKGNMRYRQEAYRPRLYQPGPQQGYKRREDPRPRYSYPRWSDNREYGEGYRRPLNEPTRRGRSRSPRRYPTTEQQQVCAVVAERSRTPTPTADTSQVNPNPQLNC